ncbi:MAG: MGMT family protein [Clostridia bacterium]|nr:MGMT family protein [Clostridia bacterium]
MFQAIYEAVKSIPRGKVATYGQIAAMVGHPRAARLVGNALHANPEPGVIPCHRVVNRNGCLAPAFAFGGREIQKQLLESEGVEVSDDFTVDMEKYCI